MHFLKHMTAFAAALVLAAPVPAHHSDAGIDLESMVAIEGTVKEFAWRNPHIYLIVESVQSGEPVDWELQMGTVATQTRMGWTRDSLSPGEWVRVRANVMTDGRPYGLLRSLDKEGGLSASLGLDALIAAQRGEGEAPPATSLAGIWRMNLNKMKRYPGGFDGFYHAQLTLTDAGRAAQAAYDPLSAENPESTCAGRPTPSMLDSTSIYMMEIDLSQQEEVVIIRGEEGHTRMVYMDGREHPDPGERFAMGHSIGWWQDDTLVVDTANFEDHRSPYQIGVPSGRQKHVIERYRLALDGTYMDAMYILEDPENLARPLVINHELLPSPHLEMIYGECDEVNAGRWVQE